MIASFLKRNVWLVNLLLIALLSYRIALLVSDSIRERVAPVYEAKATSLGLGVDSGQSFASKRTTPRAAYDLIIQRNIFGVESPYSTTASSGQNIDVGEVGRSSLSVDLLGTVVRSEMEIKSETGTREIKKGRVSTAILKNRDTGKVKSYSEGDTIDIIETEPVRVLKIDNCVAIVQRAGVRESITCNKDVKGVQSASLQNVTVRQAPAFAGPVADSEKQGISKIGEDVFEIDRGFLDEKLSNLNELLTQARVVPQSDGIKFLAIRRNSLFYDIGLRNGDTLHRINDVTLDNIENALGLFEELKQQNNFKIDITRRGKPLTYEYRVK